MAILSFNQGQASVWSAKAEDLNARTDMVMKGVSACLQEIQGESIGDMVDELVVTGTQMLEATAQLITSLNSIMDTVAQIGSKILAAMAEAAAAVTGNRGTMTHL